MKRLELLRAYFDNWQEQGYIERPNWYDDDIDDKINALNNIELLELLDLLDELHEQVSST